MKRVLVLSCMLVIIAHASFAQKYFTKTGQISFYSDTPLEKIEAHTKSATCVLDGSNGKMEFAVLIKSFQFEKALMQEHFNENYMESNKFPKSTFKGQIVNFNSVDLSKNGRYNAKVSGQLTIHGETKDVSTDAVIQVQGDKLDCQSTFEVAVADYGITIPAVVKDNIAKVVKIKVMANLEPLKQ